MKGEYFPGRHSSGVFGWDYTRASREVGEFQPPTFSYRLLQPTEDAERRWPRKNNAKGWVCFDSMEVRPDNFFFIPVCAPLAGQERTHPEITRGCLRLAVVEVYLGEQRDLSGITNIYKRVGFGGLNGTSWFDQRDEIDFLLL
jgi:hypothetical protein